LVLGQAYTSHDDSGDINEDVTTQNLSKWGSNHAKYNDQWMGFRENLQETWVFTSKK